MLQLDKLGKGLISKLTGQENPDTGMSKEDAEEMEERLKEGKMTFNDFLKQVQVLPLNLPSLSKSKALSTPDRQTLATLARNCAFFRFCFAATLLRRA